MATLVVWNFNLEDDFSDGGPAPYTSKGANLTCTSLTRGAGMTGSYSGMVLNNPWSNYQLLLFPGSGSTSLAKAISNNCYVYFTITADSGYKLNLASLTLKAGRAGSSTPRGYCVRTNIDSYASDIAAGDPTAENPSSSPKYHSKNVDLSGESYQGLSAITFRFYVYCPDTSSAMAFDDLTLTGTVDASAADVYSGRGIGRGIMRGVMR